MQNAQLSAGFYRHGSRVQHQHKLPPAAVGRTVQPGAKGGCAQRGNFFKLLGQLAPNGERPLAQHGQSGGQRFNAVRRLQQHHGAGLVGQRRHRSCPLARFGRQKTDEYKLPGLRPFLANACHAQGGRHAAGAGQGHHWQAGCAHGGHQAGAGVADGGCARVTGVGHALALVQPGNHLLGGLGLVVLVHRQQLGAVFVNAVGAQQGLGVAGVFAGNGVG